MNDEQKKRFGKLAILFVALMLGSIAVVELFS